MKLRAGSQKNNAFIINQSSEAQMQNIVQNQQVHRGSNFGATEEELQTLSGTGVPNPTFLTNEILVKSIHTSVSGSDAQNTKLVNKLYQGYETLS